MDFNLDSAERIRLSSLMAAMSTTLLLLFGFKVFLPLLPPRLTDPTWQLALCGGLCGSGGLALLAVLLVHLAAAIDPNLMWLKHRRQWLVELCRWLSIAFLLLIPLQVWAAWQTLEQVSRIEDRIFLRSLEKITRMRHAITRSDSHTSLQANLKAIKAPPLGPEDQGQRLSDLKKRMLSQLHIAEQLARRTQVVTRDSVGVRTEIQDASRRRQFLLIDSIRVVLLALSLGMGFAAAAQRKGSALSQRAEWGLIVVNCLNALIDWLEHRRSSEHRISRGHIADADYFDSLSQGEDNPPDH